VSLVLAYRIFIPWLLFVALGTTLVLVLFMGQSAVEVLEHHLQEEEPYLTDIVRAFLVHQGVCSYGHLLLVGSGEMSMFSSETYYHYGPSKCTREGRNFYIRFHVLYCG
jgi:hypothetical protein